MAKGERTRSRTLNQGQIKIRILAYLYNRGKDGANAYTIERKSNIPHQEYGRLREFLDEMSSLNLITKYEQETGGDKARIFYKITQDGRDTVDIYRKSYMPDDCETCIFRRH